VDGNGCAIPRDQVCCLRDDQATREEVLEALKQAVARAGPEDAVYLYFAGHGVSTKPDPQGASDFYLCTSGAQPSRLAETAVSGADLERVLGPAACRGILIILDCCEGASIAEGAPSMFRKLRQGDFRILLSSVRADQRSWERADGSGTLFTNALVAALKANLLVGGTPGALYFSDLVSAIDKRVEEDLLALPGLPRQDMVFVGTYIRDPLIFVHRTLSLQQVQFATARFSPSYVRRVLVKAMLIVSGLTFFGLTTAYGILDATQYAVDEGGTFVIYQGRPGFNLPGYPRRIWTLSYGAERLVSDGAELRGIQIIAPMGRPVLPLVEARLRPDMQLLDLYGSGRTAAARALALKTMADDGAQFEIRRNAHLVFASVAEPADMPVLKRWLADERVEIRRAGLRALMKLDPAVGFAAAERLVDHDQSDAHTDIIKLLEGGCPEPVARYLANRFDTSSSHPTSAQIFDAVVRLGCQLPTRALLRSMERPQLYGDTNVVNYAKLTGMETALVDAIVERLSEDKPDMLRLATLVGTLAELPQAPCLALYSQELGARMQHARLMAMVAIARHCPGGRLVFDWDPEQKAATVGLWERDVHVADLVLATKDNQARHALTLLTRLPDVHATRESLRELIRSLLTSDRDDYLRRHLIRALIQLGDRAELPAALLDSNNLEVREAVVEYKRNAGDTMVRQQLMDRIGSDDEFYVGLLGRMPLDEPSTTTLLAAVSGSRNERRQAACVLAMGAPTETVLKLLTHRESIVRGEAANCASFNARSDEISAKVPKTANGFPIESHQWLKEQAERKAELVDALARMKPELKAWRLSLVDATPGGFGRLGRGLRYWLDEQRFEVGRKGNAE
jgi:HEAT repeat protein